MYSKVISSGELISISRNRNNSRKVELSNFTQRPVVLILYFREYNNFGMRTGIGTRQVSLFRDALYFFNTSAKNVAFLQR
jgi:hypothetical protein